MKALILYHLHISISAARGKISQFAIRIVADVCILAGDVCYSLLGIEWVGAVIASKMPVVMALGNDDYYGEDLKSGVSRARWIAREHPDLHILDNNEVTISDVRFIGGTLWTDFEFFANDPAPMTASYCGGLAKREMPDFGEIYETPSEYSIMSRVIQPRDLVERHRATLAYLDNALAKPSRTKTVVITHHAPHRNSMHPKLASDPTSAAFASDLSRLITERKPPLWVHGHVHTSFDYTVRETRILCNPLGYDSSVNPYFNSGLFVGLLHGNEGCFVGVFAIARPLETRRRSPLPR